MNYHMEDREISSDNSGDNSPPSTTFNASISSPKRRRAIQKKVMTFPLKEIEGSRFKGDCTPPSDSWAWRKYGQKPIKDHHEIHDPLLHPTDELSWFTSDHQILENNEFLSNFNDLDMSKIFPMREEDESLFADLGELPECSVVFRKAAGVAAVEECNLAPTTWCGTTG
uniref:Uncharacterized protein n=1 Tax=Chenopodium quinoa TaxID=63459 RepID=A0A803N2R9_CHEQI